MLKLLEISSKRLHVPVCVCVCLFLRELFINVHQNPPKVNMSSATYFKNKSHQTCYSATPHPGPRDPWEGCGWEKLPKPSDLFQLPKPEVPATQISNSQVCPRWPLAVSVWADRSVPWALPQQEVRPAFLYLGRGSCTEHHRSRPLTHLSPGLVLPGSTPTSMKRIGKV